MTYELYYWTGIQGRGEYVRLALEAAQAPYRDIAREKGDGVIEALSEALERPSFAPPFLKDGEMVIGQTSAILHYLGPKLNLVPKDEQLRLWTLQIQLTIADFVVEAHDAHHPLGPGRYYQDQKGEAARRASEFRHMRVPKFFRWFEMILKRNPAGPSFLVGDGISYADLSLFQIVSGMNYAFPELMSDIAGDHPNVFALHDRVATQPAIAAYLASERRLPPNEDDLFRHYPELDGKQ